jgi:hypothetical protein
MRRQRNLFLFGACTGLLLGLLLIEIAVSLDSTHESTPSAEETRPEHGEDEVRRVLQVIGVCFVAASSAVALVVPVLALVRRRRDSSRQR